MAHRKSIASSVADIRAMFERKSTEKDDKPRERVKARKHSSSDFWENRFKIKQPEFIRGPSRIYKKWEHEENEYKSKQFNSNPGKVGNWNPQNNFTKEKVKVGKLTISDKV